MNNKQLQALQLLTTSGRGATDLAIVIVSKQASTLLAAGLICYAASNKWGYALTAAGRQAVGLDLRSAT